MSNSSLIGAIGFAYWDFMPNFALRKKSSNIIKIHFL